MDPLNLDKVSLKKFSSTMAVCLCVLGGVLLWRQNGSSVWFWGAGAVFFLVGRVAPDALKPVYIVWMKLAFVLGWINTRIILFFVFYGIVTPIGLLMRLLGTDALDQKMEKEKPTYWRDREREEFKPSDYERQF